MATVELNPKIREKLSERMKTVATGYKLRSIDEKCIICSASGNVFSTTVMCGARPYWGPICENKDCLDKVLANDKLIKTHFTLLPN